MIKKGHNEHVAVVRTYVRNITDIRSSIYNI